MIFMIIAMVATLATEIGVIWGVIRPIIKSVTRIANGQKCQLRSDMLRIYYKCRESKKIHQYEYENFVMLYEAYKALNGNSFIDEIYEKLQAWEIVP